MPDRIVSDSSTIFVPLIEGQTVKLEGQSQILEGYATRSIHKKCVVTIQTQIIDTYVVTAMPNFVETD